MDILIYMAGPLFSHAERYFLERMVSELAESAQLDTGPISSCRIGMAVS